MWEWTPRERFKEHDTTKACMMDILMREYKSRNNGTSFFKQEKHNKRGYLMGHGAFITLAILTNE